MSNIFNLKRFGNYFAYDCRRAWNQFGLSLVLIALAPVIAFIIMQFFSLIFNGHMAGMESGVRFGFMVFGAAIVTMIAPSAIYGNLTEKKSGSSWLMIPVSSFEKWLSMVLVLLVVLLVAFFGVFFAGDGLLSLIFPSLYGNWTATDLSSLYSKYLQAINASEMPVTFNIPAMLFCGWAGWVLVFTLGALYFKRAKVARTILVIFGLSLVFGLLVSLFMVNGGEQIIEKLVERLDLISNPRRIVTSLNVFMNAEELIFKGGLLVWLFFRIKSLKH